MGTTVWQHKPAGVSAIDALKANFGPEFCSRIVGATATREAVFFAVRFNDPFAGKVYQPDPDGTCRGLLVCKLSLRPREYHNFGYKDMDETMGPYGCEAPLSILAQCSELQPLPADAGEAWSPLKSAHDYRARCRAMAASKVAKRRLKPGDKVTLRAPLSFGGTMLQTFTVEQHRVRGRAAKSSTVFRADNGMLCSITARSLEGSTIS